MKQTLRFRKQDLVKGAIYDAAIELFVVRGFDQSTVEDIANAAGVSRRSFFRYFASKDDLLAQPVLSYGAALAQAIQNCPEPLSPLLVLKRTTHAGVEHSRSHEARIRQVVQIASKSPAARQAHGSRLMQVEDMLTEVAAKRFAGTTGRTMDSRLLASLALAIISSATVNWIKGDFEDLVSAAEHVLKELTNAFCPPDLRAGRASASSGKQTAGTVRSSKKT